MLEFSRNYFGESWISDAHQFPQIQSWKKIDVRKINTDYHATPYMRVNLFWVTGAFSHNGTYQQALGSNKPT